MKERLEADIKAALLSGDKEKARALSFIKNSITSVEKDSGRQLTDDEAIVVLRKEVKKRLEAAELFEKGGNQDSSQKEKIEAELISTYLPAQLSRDDIKKTAIKIIEELSIPLEQSSMGRIIGTVKSKLGSNADSSLIAQVVSDLIRGV